MKPQAGRERFDVRQEGEAVVLVDRTSRQEIQLDPVAGAVWLRADGTLDVQQLSAAVSRDLDALVGEPEVWAALDALGDAGLLEGRTAPPADSSLSRRFLLGSAAAVGTLLVGGAGTALASSDKAKSGSGKDNDDLGRWRSAAEQAQKGEQGAKTQESQAKTSYESSVKGEQGAKGAENAAKTTAEAAEKTSLDTFGQLRTAQEESNKLGTQLSVLQAKEQENKASIAAEQRQKGDASAAEQQRKAAAEQDEKQSAQLQEQKVKAAAEQDQKQSAQAAEQKQKQAAQEQQQKQSAQAAEQKVKASAEQDSKAAAEQSAKSSQQ